MCAVAIVVYLVFAQGVEQPWAVIHTLQQETDSGLHTSASNVDISKTNTSKINECLQLDNDNLDDLDAEKIAYL